MIQQLKKIEINEKSHPFASARGKLGFEKAGYIEEEYFMYGTANVYEEVDAWNCKIVYDNMPYCNRFLLRKPADMSKFSGNIVIEILNTTAGIDLDRMWVCGAKELMRDGAIYVGITSKQNTIPPMLALDAERYADISWKVPYRWPEPDENAVISFLAPRDNDSEAGLIWDMLTDLANKLRGDFIETDVKKYIYLFGWSQSTAYLRAYARYIAFQNKEDRIFDGYFSGGGIHHFRQPLNQSGYADEERLEWTKLEYMPVPFIALQTESECVGLGGNTEISRKEDGDSADMMYRRYDIAGTTHDTKFSQVDYFAGDPDYVKINHVPEYGALNVYPNDYPYEYCFNAVIRKLFDWVQKGIAPMSGKLVAIDANGEKIKDEFGNSVGGMRTPLIEHPVCTYYDYSDSEPNFIFPDGINMLFGHMEPFSKEKINQLYHSQAEYRALIESSAKKCVENGDMLAEDIADYVEMAVARAVALGLE